MATTQRSQLNLRFNLIGAIKKQERRERRSVAVPHFSLGRLLTDRLVDFATDDVFRHNLESTEEGESGDEPGTCARGTPPLLGKPRQCSFYRGGARRRPIDATLQPTPLEIVYPCGSPACL